MLKYGQSCDRYHDKCTNGAKCIDKVCKCAPGFNLSRSGWCEGFILQKAIENNRNEQGQKKMAHTTKAQRTKVEKSTSAPHTIASTILKQLPFMKTATNTVTIPPTVATTTARAISRKTTPRGIMMTKSNTTPTRKNVPRVAAIGSKCRAIDICLGDSQCVDGYCRCEAGYIEQNGNCISRNSKHKVAKVGESCKNKEICTGGSICDYDQKKCICAAQHIAINSMCKLKTSKSISAPGDTCGMGEICAGGSSCFQGMCTCDSNHFSEDGYCRPIAAKSSKVHFVNGSGLRFSSKPIVQRMRAQPCNESECRLPKCFCSTTGKKAPGGLQPNETPQFVVLTFDDAVNGKTFPDYKDLFENDVLKNPNGCDVKATFFISHEWTNYDAVNWLVEKNMEIASNSISHENLEHEDTERWLNEMDGQRRILAKFGGVPEENIVGIRSPQLSLGGDRQFEMMAGAEFEWDNSMSANPGIHGEPYWPQTLDYSVAWPCHEASCPKSSFPGIWSIPMNQFYGSYMRQIDSFRRSSMLRAAVDLNSTIEELESVIMRNFERSYTTNRAPYVLTLNADFLQLGGEQKGMKALKMYLNKMSQMKDVYIVTMKQLVEWMKNPVSLNEIKKFKPLGCPISLTFNRNPSMQSFCEKPNKCLYSTPSLASQEHQFITCLPCPTMYPWIENPAGSIV